MPKPTTDRPTEPGTYWMRPAVPAGEATYVWTVVEIYRMADNRLLLAIPKRNDMPNLDDEECDEHEWLGPITPEDAIRVAQLKATGSRLIESLEELACRFEDDAASLKRVLAAGNALAKVAKEAAVRLDGPDNAPIRDRLCGAIAGWLERFADKP